MATSQYQRRPKPRRRSATAVLLAGFVALAAVVGVGAAILAPRAIDRFLTEEQGELSSSTEPPDTTSADGADGALATFADALAAGDLGPITFAGTTPAPDDPGVVVPDADGPGAAVSTEYEALTGGMAPFSLTVTPGVVAVTGPLQAAAPIDLEWSFPGDLSWSTSSQVDLEQIDGDWLVRWDPSILESSLRTGDALERTRLDVGRAPILARDGTVLVGDVTLVQVGIQPSRVQDLASLTGRLQELVGVDPVELSGRVGAAAPDAFVDVTTLPRAEYDLIRDEIFPLPGTVFRQSNRPVALDENFARALLGRSGEVTAEILEQNPGLYSIGDYAGLSGLQALFNAELTGKPGAEITVNRAPLDPSSTTTGTGLTTTSAVRTGPDVDVLSTIDAQPGRPVITTIDPAMQRAAEDALQATQLPSAMVAVEVSTGEIVALANGPTGATVNFALTGQYPPGSIFKIVSGYALLQSGLEQGDPLDCPASVRVDGRSFANAENEVFGVIPFRSAFAHSCNTAFVGGTLDFAPETLHDAALAFGLGDEYDLGVPAFSGSVPVAADRVDLAASSFGQGRLLFSPMSAAVMAATAADGVYRSPRLVTSPTPDAQTTVALDRDSAETLQELMRAVVTEGTGRAVAGANGGPVSGKTGTAEFGNDNPPRSHAWFVGFQGDIAFAVFVEGGEFGGSTSAPIARAFLDSVAARRFVQAPPGSTTTTQADGTDPNATDPNGTDPDNPENTTPDNTTPDGGEQSTTTTAGG